MSNSSLRLKIVLRDPCWFNFPNFNGEGFASISPDSYLEIFLPCSLTGIRLALSSIVGIDGFLELITANPYEFDSLETDRPNLFTKPSATC